METDSRGGGAGRARTVARRRGQRLGRSGDLTSMSKGVCGRARVHQRALCAERARWWVGELPVRGGGCSVSPLLSPRTAAGACAWLRVVCRVHAELTHWTRAPQLPPARDRSSIPPPTTSPRLSSRPLSRQCRPERVRSLHPRHSKTRADPRSLAPPLSHPSPDFDLRKMCYPPPSRPLAPARPLVHRLDG